MTSHINVGTGEDITIKELANLIREVIGFKGKIEFDKSKPDGPPRKLVDSSLINILGFSPKINFRDGLIKTYQDYIKFNADF